MSNAELASVIISLIALAIALASLWASSLAPFRLRVLCDSPTFSVYKVTPQISGNTEDKTWWIPSFDLGISLYNTGSQLGEVLDVRLVGLMESHRTRKSFVFYPKWIVDYTKFQELKTDRLAWIQSAVIREWYPVLLRSKDETCLHLILEGDRWDQKETGALALTLEVATAPGRWRDYRKFLLHYDEDIFETNCSYTAYSREMENLRKV